MFKPNNFQQQQNQAQQKQFQNAFNQANKLQQQQFNQTAARWRRQSRDRQSKLIQAGYQRNREAEAILHRRKALAAAQIASVYRCQFCDAPISTGNAFCINCGVPVQQLRPGQTSVRRHSSWKKSIFIMVLIAVAVLVLGAIGHAHNSPVTPPGTPGVISVGANIRTGPGTENSIAATAVAGTRIIIGCRIATHEGYWDRLKSSPYRGLYVSVTVVNSNRPAGC